MKSRIEFAQANLERELGIVRRPPPKVVVSKRVPNSGDGWRLVKANAEVIEFALFGTLQTNAAVHVADAIANELAQGEPRTLVLDVVDLDDCAQEARTVLEEVLEPMQARLGGITLVGGVALVRMAFAVLAMKLGVKIEKRAREVTDIGGDAVAPANAKASPARWVELT